MDSLPKVLDRKEPNAVWQRKNADGNPLPNPWEPPDFSAAFQPGPHELFVQRLQDYAVVPLDWEFVLSMFRCHDWDDHFFATERLTTGSDSGPTHAAIANIIIKAASHFSSNPKSYVTY